MHEAMEKQMKVREEEMFCIKERIKELEERKCALKKSWKESESVNGILQKQIVLKDS